MADQHSSGGAHAAAELEVPQTLVQQHQKVWNWYTNLTTIVAGALVVLLILLRVFLV